jgi:hypothetical protein
MQISSNVLKLSKEVTRSFILSNSHVPCKMYWDLAVERALQIINRSSSPLTKVFERAYSIYIYCKSSIKCIILPLTVYNPSLFLDQ